MTPPWRPIVEDLLAAYRAGRHLILLFDYDGTLVPIADHPRLARLTPHGRRLLESLAGQPRVHLGILSGRALEDLKEILCLGNLCLAGTSGLELDLYGLQLVHPRARRARALIEDIAHRVSAALAPFPGAWLEDKRLGFTVHFRHTPPHLTQRLRLHVREILEPVSSALRSDDGPMALEVTPNLDWHKGTAVSMIVRHLRPYAHALLYAGDSANDAAALETTIALGGMGIGVGPEAPPAQYCLPDAEAVQELLADLERGVSAATGPAGLTPALRRQRSA